MTIAAPSMTTLDAEAWRARCAGWVRSPDLGCMRPRIPPRWKYLGSAAAWPGWLGSNARGDDGHGRRGNGWRRASGPRCARRRLPWRCPRAPLTEHRSWSLGGARCEFGVARVACDAENAHRAGERLDGNRSAAAGAESSCSSRSRPSSNSNGPPRCCAARRRIGNLRDNVSRPVPGRCTSGSIAPPVDLSSREALLSSRWS